MKRLIMLVKKKVICEKELKNCDNVFIAVMLSAKLAVLNKLIRSCN